MENTNLTNSLKRELEMQTERYNSAIDSAIELLNQAKGRKPSDHLGHNLASRASELSTLAGKIEQTDNMIRWATEANKCGTHFCTKEAGHAGECAHEGAK